MQRLQAGGVPANYLAKELGVSIWSLRRWSRQYRKRTAAGAGAARERAAPPAAPEELPAKPSSERTVTPPVGEDGLCATIAQIELEISTLDKQREALKTAVEDLETTFGRHAGIKCYRTADCRLYIPCGDQLIAFPDRQYEPSGGRKSLSKMRLVPLSKKAHLSNPWIDL